MQSFYSRLDHTDLLEVSGEDSGKFLQGQLTCDLDSIKDGSIHLGAACNNKGRVYSNFRIFHKGSSFFLIMQSGLLSITESTLQKFIPFYKAAIENANDKYHRFGFAGDEAESALNEIVQNLPAKNNSVEEDGAILINLGQALPRYELWLEDPQNKKYSAVFEKLPALDKDNWNALDQASGIPFIQPAETTLYTPEELNLDLSGFVSFDKGCYTGQEIIARMHYRGKASKRLHAVTLDAEAIPTDKTLYNPSGNSLGILFNILLLKNKKMTAFIVIKSDGDFADSYCNDDAGAKIPAKIRLLTYAETSTH